jgi:tetratricopeptide (TPR) repeat protein
LKAIALLILMASCVQFAAAASPVDQALQNGEVDKALQMLASLPSSEAHLYRCRINMMLERWNEAADECEKAVRENPQNYLNHLWLGRALGERASRANFFSAYSLGKRVHREFEEAVRLNPQSPEALSDLCEFEYDAPSAVGGNSEHAMQLASQVEKLDPGRGIELRARIEAAHKNYSAAEQEFKRALAAASHPAYQWFALASFYRSQKRLSEMETAIENAQKAVERDPKSAPVLYDCASLLLRAKRRPDLAEKLLSAYLSSPYKSEQAPAFIAHARLAALLDARGDKAGAETERAAAHDLARDYKISEERAH